MSQLFLSVESHSDCRYGVIAQLVERLLSMQEALGSTPSNSIFLSHLKSARPLSILSEFWRDVMLIVFCWVYVSSIHRHFMICFMCNNIQVTKYYFISFNLLWLIVIIEKECITTLIDVHRRWTHSKLSQFMLNLQIRVKILIISQSM